MSVSSTWLEWLAGLARSSGWWGPVPGSHQAFLEEVRVGALMQKEGCKPPGQRDEELVHRLRVRYRKQQLQNMQAKVDWFEQTAAKFERPGFECCAAAVWVRQRLAASYRAQQDYVHQRIRQVTEELAAAEARRRPALLVQPTMRLHLPEALQQPPPRLEMCSACARQLEDAERREQSRVLHGQHMQAHYQTRRLQPAHVAASPDAAEAAAAAEASSACEAQQSSQQQQQQCGSGGVSANEPATPTPQQQQHAFSQEEGEQRQHTASIVAATQQAVAPQLAPKQG